jgi:hypothetical protein
MGEEGGNVWVLECWFLRYWSRGTLTMVMDQGGYLQMSIGVRPGKCVR